MIIVGSTNIAMIIVGRMLLGPGIGFSSLATPVRTCTV
jgi:hypothetical protein